MASDTKPITASAIHETAALFHRWYGGRAEAFVTGLMEIGPHKDDPVALAAWGGVLAALRDMKQGGAGSGWGGAGAVPGSTAALPSPDERVSARRLFKFSKQAG